MKIFKRYSLLLLALVFVMQGCYDNPTFLEENAEIGEKYPVLANVTGFEDQYNTGDTATFKLEYFSEVEIESINLYEQIVTDGDTSENQVFSRPYEPAFSESLRLDTMMVEYEVPDIPSGSEITLTSEVVNTNTLSDSQSFTFTITAEE